MNFLDTYRAGVATFVGLASLVIGAIVATWGNLGSLLGENGIYDAGQNDASIFLLVAGIALSAIIGYTVDELSNRY